MIKFGQAFPHFTAKYQHMFARIPVPVRLSLAYLIFGILWIVFSGQLAARIAAGNTERMQEIEQYKGIFFVLLSTLFLLILSRSMYKRLIRTLEEYKIMEKKNDALVTATKEGIYEYNIREDKVIFNATMRQILDITNNKTIYDARRFWETHIHPDDLQRVLQQFDGAMKAGINYWREEYRALTITGQVRHVLHSVYILKDDWGTAYGVIGAIHDMTEFRLLEREYHRQQLLQKMELTRSVINAEEKERNRWAEELHDNIAQMLSVATLYAGSLQQGGKDTDALAARIKEMLDMSVQEIRQLSANLKPPRFEEQLLKDAIASLIRYITRVKSVEFSVLVAEEADQLLDEEQKLMVYRIVQEQVNNIIKHAAASAISIRIEASEENALVRISDNGRGFDVHIQPEGTGMKNIRSRLELFQGALHIKSSPGRGCELQASFPLQQPA